MSAAVVAHQRAHVLGLAHGVTRPDDDPCEDTDLMADVLEQVGWKHDGECECETCEAILSAHYCAWDRVVNPDEPPADKAARVETLHVLEDVLAAHEPVTLWKCSCGRNGKGTITNAVEHRTFEVYRALLGRTIPTS